MNSLEERFKYYLSSVIYDELKIMINDITPTITALKIFIDDIILTPKDEDIVYRIEDIEAYIDNDIQEFRINDNQNYMCTIINLDINNVKKYFDQEKDTYFEKLKDKNIIIPKELYGTLFICSLEAVKYFVDKGEIHYIDEFIKSIGREE